MARITQLQSARTMVQTILNNRENVDKYSQEISTGYAVEQPGDSRYAGTIAQYKDTLNRIASYKNRVAEVKASLIYQDDIMSQANDLLIRAKEIAQQAANETNGTVNRAEMAEEVLQIRDHMVSLANSKYQGRYLYGGAIDDTAPYMADTYTNSSGGGDRLRYIYNKDGEQGSDVTNTVQLTDDLSVTTNTPGNQVFDQSIQGLERLARSLKGYRTTPAPTTATPGAPDGGGVAYDFKTEFSEQTEDIRAALDQLAAAGNNDIMPERVALGGKIRRLETADSLLDLNKDGSTDVLGRLQDADVVDAASKLAAAQSALQASYQVTSKILNQSILDYL